MKKEKKEEIISAEVPAEDAEVTEPAVEETPADAAVTSELSREAPAEEHGSAEDLSIDDAADDVALIAPFTEDASAEEPAPIEDAAPVEDAAPIEEAAPAEAGAEALSEEDLAAEADVTPVVSPSFVMPEEPAPSPEEAPEACPAAEGSAPAEAPAKPRYSGSEPVGYGAPQMLYEDFIPYEYLHDTPAPSSGESNAEIAAREAALAREEEENKKKKKEKKEKKPSREEAEILAAVEAEMASRSDGAPAESISPAPAPVAETPVVPAPPVVGAVAAEPEEAVMAEETVNTPPATREYTSHEKRLRRQYKIDTDVLLSANDVIPGFVLAKGENVVRCYNSLDSDKGTGTICLTNKRLLINADECSEVEVGSVSGIKFSKNTYFSFFKFLFALIFLGLGAFMIALPFIKDGVNIPYVTGEAWKDWFKYLFIACGAVSVLISLPLWATMVKRYFYFNVFVKESAPFFECKSKSVIRSEKNGGQFKFLVSDAGKEIEKVARELGALIIEVKDGRYNF